MKKGYETLRDFFAPLLGAIFGVRFRTIIRVETVRHIWALPQVKCSLRLPKGKIKIPSISSGNVAQSMPLVLLIAVFRRFGFSGTCGGFWSMFLDEFYSKRPSL